MRSPSAEILLSAWERGNRYHALDRAVLLHSLAAPEREPDQLADEPVGLRNAALLRLRSTVFGDELRAGLFCPKCGERLEFKIIASLLFATHPGEATIVEVDGLRFRPPSSRDLATLLRDSSDEPAPVRLMKSCLLEQNVNEDLEPLMGRVEVALEEADPLADVTIDSCCEACGHAWSAPFDIPAFLWEELEAFARRLLDDVHTLARAYGWSEAQILGLSEARRSSYLERITA